MQVWVVGGTQGIGAAWVKHLRGQGHEVWTGARHPAPSQSVVIDLSDRLAFNLLWRLP